MQLLNQLYTRMDDLLDIYGVYKVCVCTAAGMCTAAFMCCHVYVVHCVCAAACMCCHVYVLQHVCTAAFTWLDDLLDILGACKVTR